MLDSGDFLKLIKKTAMDAFAASKPTEIIFGKVASASPLKINIDQKLTLTTAQLILTRNVTEYSTDIYVDWITNTNDGHSHSIAGNKRITVHNSLVVGDEVVLLRMQGGQKYIVLDRVST